MIPWDVIILVYKLIEKLLFNPHSRNIIQTTMFSFLLLLITVNEISAKSPVYHQIPILHNKCQELAKEISKTPSNFSVLSDVEINTLAEPLIQDLGPLSLSPTSPNRFQLTIKREDQFIPRHGSCTVAFQDSYLTCSYSFQAHESRVKLYYIVTAETPIACMDDMRPNIRVWDFVEDTECVLDFGLSCCIYDPEDYADETPSRWREFAIYSLCCVLMVMLLVYILVKIKGKVQLRKRVRRVQGL